ncbi:MAG: hypothetical protein H6739_10415 [Alphaproteobacteria bacterium]|nr:hypothetical protein [Alphaproteobacteria bacterium]
MRWTTLLSTSQEVTVPWTGGHRVCGRGRRWRIAGATPTEVGWHRFSVSGGRQARWLGPAEPVEGYEQGRVTRRGYALGDRLVPDEAGVHPDPARAFAQSERLWLAPVGLERFARVLAARSDDGREVFVRQEFPMGPEPEVQAAWEDGLEHIDHIPGVSPALELCFRWLVHQRRLAQERAARLAAEREARARRERLRGLLGDGARRRVMAMEDFDAAARAALAVSGAELLDHRPGTEGFDTVVRFRFGHRRFECVVETGTLRILDAGICLEDHTTGERGDRRFTLESLPAVIDEATRSGVLHVYRAA